jgi:hypothetical protein
VNKQPTTTDEQVETSSTGEKQIDTSGDDMPAWIKALRSYAKSFIQPVWTSFLPKPHYLEGEEVTRIFQMAPYRAQIPETSIVLCLIAVLIAAAIFIASLTMDLEAMTLLGGALGIGGLILLVRSAEARLEYEQWKFILTNKRVILVTPDPERQLFADTIYLKEGSIKVLDTNFSKNPIWGFFQITRGTRDVMLSLSGYEFQETGAKVKGGLRFPDVEEENVRALEELIFG